MRTSSMEAFFPPQSEHVLDRTIGKAEKYRVRSGTVAVCVPTRNDENVARLPVEYGVANDRFTGAFDNGINRAVGGPIRHGVEAARQQCHKRANRWHRRTTRSRIDVA